MIATFATTTHAGGSLAAFMLLSAGIFVDARTAAGSGAAEVLHLPLGLDIGTSKVVAIVGEISPDNSIEVVGLGSHPSRGLKKGVVVKLAPPQVTEALKIIGAKRMPDAGDPHAREFVEIPVTTPREVERAMMWLRRACRLGRTAAGPV